MYQDAALVLGVIILTYTVLRLGWRRRRASHEPSPLADPEFRGPQAAPAPVELSQLLVQLQEVGREIEARLDTKIRYAQRLLDESATVLARLEGAVARGDQVGSPREAPVAASEAPAPAPESPPPAPSVADQEQADRLLEEGKSTAEIAQALDRPVGEVELILALSRRAQQGPSLG